MKPGDKLTSVPCGPGKPCAVLAALLKETEERRPKAGGAGLEEGICLAPKATTPSLILYSTGKSTRAAPATLIRVEWCPFCRGPLTAEAAEERKRAAPRGEPIALTPQRLARAAREALILWMADHDEGTRIADVPGLGPDDTVEILAKWVRDALIVAELDEHLRQMLGFDHADTCEHYLCPEMPCVGGPTCNWTKEKRADAPKCCGRKP